MKLQKNLILMTDTYKFASHWNMLKKKVNNTWVYGAARVGAQFDFTLFYGLQYILMEHLEGVVVEQWMLNEAQEIAQFHVGNKKAVNVDGWQTIIDYFDGKLPIIIDAIPEGLKVPAGNMLFSVRLTEEAERHEINLDWLVNYLEGIIQKVWYPCTVATQSFHLVEAARKACERTSDNPDIYKFMVHDFGYRSTTCEEQALIGGSAHLINSLGTDTVGAMRFLKNYYDANYSNLAFSVPATEHRISCSYGSGSGEFEYLEYNMQQYPDGPLSIVADTYGIENFVKNVVCSDRIANTILKRRVVSPNPLTKVVIRPDSPRFKGDTAHNQIVWILTTLGLKFGVTKNSKGFKVLNPAISVLYGDGLNYQDILDIYSHLEANGWSAENCIVGQGGGLLQKVNRDQQRFAIKCSAERIGDTWVGLQKNPQDKSKSSFAGRLKLVKHVEPGGSFRWDTISESYPLYYDMPDELVEVFNNGKVVKKYTFDEIKHNASQ